MNLRKQEINIAFPTRHFHSVEAIPFHSSEPVPANERAKQCVLNGMAAISHFAFA